MNFDPAFTFKYSRRPGTKASEYEAVVPEEEKQVRLDELLALQKCHTLFRNSQEVGKTVDVLVEKESKKSTMQWIGRTEGNMGVIFNKGNEQPKDIIDILIQDAQGVSLFGQQC